MSSRRSVGLKGEEGGIGVGLLAALGMAGPHGLREAEKKSKKKKTN